MKDGTRYASRLKGVFTRLRKGVEAPPAAPEDPLRRLGISIFSENGNENAAVRAVDRMFKTLVDWNEVRVSTPTEIVAASGLGVNDGPPRTARLIEALRGIYTRENRVSLDFLKEMPRRECRQFLEKLDGLSPYTTASIILWSLGGHAIPVDERLMSALRASDLVHPEATLEEVQAFLERNVSAADAREFCVAIRRLVDEGPIEVEKKSAAKPAKGEKPAAKAKPKAEAGPKAQKAAKSAKPARSKKADASDNGSKPTAAPARKAAAKPAAKPAPRAAAAKAPRKRQASAE